MKKIMFNDDYGLERAVLNGNKTMTRRAIPCRVCQDVLTPIRYNGSDVSHDSMAMKHAHYKVGDVIAIAQSYHSIAKVLEERKGKRTDSSLDKYYIARQMGHICDTDAGWDNKMFVKAELMPHSIRITDIKIERLQDITDEDCIKEGVRYAPMRNEENYKSYTFDGWKRRRNGFDYDCYAINPREAFRVLINKVSGAGTWEINPWVFVYSFELIK